MRILFLNDLHDPRIGSSIRQMYQQSERLRELGHEAAVATTSQDASEVGPTTIEGTPVVLIRGLPPVDTTQTTADMIRPAADDLFT